LVAGSKKTPNKREKKKAHTWGKTPRQKKESPLTPRGVNLTLGGPLTKNKKSDEKTKNVEPASSKGLKRNQDRKPEKKKGATGGKKGVKDS